MSRQPRVLITGGAGFIGSHLVRAFQRLNWGVTVFDSLTYAGFYHNVRSAVELGGAQFFYGDLRHSHEVRACFQMHGPFDVVVHAAAESSVDRSISGYEDFLTSNVIGSANLFQVCRETRVRRVINFGTDEIFGHFADGQSGSFDEHSPVQPRNIYSASKAAQYQIARAFQITHGVPIITVCPSNCYGPRQHAEKLIPKIIHSILHGRPTPIYNGGKNVREWLFVGDVASAITLLAADGTPGELYTIGGGEERNVLEILDGVTARVCRWTGINRSEVRLNQLPARPGDDHRYSVTCSKLRALGWRPEASLDDGLDATVAWYLQDEGRAFLEYAAARIL